MEKNNEIFDVTTAQALMEQYEDDRRFIKVKLVKALISWQRMFDNKTIVGATICVPGFYHETIIQEVLNVLGYTLSFYDYEYKKNSFGIISREAETRFKFEKL